MQHLWTMESHGVFVFVVDPDLVKFRIHSFKLTSSLEHSIFLVEVVVLQSTALNKSC